MRAERLGVGSERLLVYPESDLTAIAEQVERLRPAMVVIDSIQTIYRPDLTSAPGSVSQVRESAGQLMLLAKGTGVPIFLVGHVNKEGAIAGPRVLEHIVDTVLYLEGDRHHAFRILRSAKNRFGSTDEIGVFEMQDAGMVEVRDPSLAFLSERSLQSQGTAVVVTMEGTRPLLLEIQSLVTATAFGMPRRSVTGIDLNRLHLLVAVLEKRAGLALGQQDIFVNVAGGARITEPAADLGVAIAVASNVRMRALGQDWVVIGEVGLAGEVRHVSQLERRLAEAEKLGFQHALIPAGRLRRESNPRLRLHIAETVSDAIELCFN
jgi:DNA repair protein RadA/Sms